MKSFLQNFILGPFVFIFLLFLPLVVVSSLSGKTLAKSDPAMGGDDGLKVTHPNGAESYGDE